MGLLFSTKPAKNQSGDDVAEPPLTKAEVKAQKQAESVPAARESSEVVFAHLAGYKARPVSLQSLGR